MPSGIPRLTFAFEFCMMFLGRLQGAPLTLLTVHFLSSHEEGGCLCGGEPVFLGWRLLVPAGSRLTLTFIYMFFIMYLTACAFVTV